MGYYVSRMKRPYDFRVLIEAYIYTLRKDFVHEAFSNYYTSLLAALEKLFGIRMSNEYLSFKEKILWMLFNSTAESLLQITNPWAGFLEAGLLHTKLEESGEQGRVVYKASEVIGEANEASEAAHREILYALFVAIFGESSRIVTSEELLQAGLDDSKEPDISDYLNYI